MVAIDSTHCWSARLSMTTSTMIVTSRTHLTTGFTRKNDVPDNPVMLPPRLTLMQFDGNPLNWPHSIQSFKVQVHDAVRSDAECIAHLTYFLPVQINSEFG